MFVIQIQVQTVGLNHILAETNLASQTKQPYVYCLPFLEEMSKAVVIPECNKDIGGMKEELSVSPNGKKDGAISLFSRLLRLDSLGKKNITPECPTAVESSTIYYGVYIPCEIKKGPDEGNINTFCLICLHFLSYIILINMQVS